MGAAMGGLIGSVAERTLVPRAVLEPAVSQGQIVDFLVLEVEPPLQCEVHLRTWDALDAAQHLLVRLEDSVVVGQLPFKFSLFLYCNLFECAVGPQFLAEAVVSSRRDRVDLALGGLLLGDRLSGPFKESRKAFLGVTKHE